MAVESGIISVVYAVTSGSAGQEFPIPFPYIEKEHVSAYYAVDGEKTALTYGTDYTVNNAALTVTGALPVGAKLVIHRETPQTQDIVWVDGQAIYAPDIMQADDKLTYITQEMQEQLDRAIKITNEDAASGMAPEDLREALFAARDAAAESASDSSDYADASAASALLSQAWAESDSAPDAEDENSKSAKSWAELSAEAEAVTAEAKEQVEEWLNQAHAWAESPLPPDPNDPASKSAKEWALSAAQSVPIASTEYAGKVKADGKSIGIEPDGTLFVQGGIAASSAGVSEIDVSTAAVFSKTITGPTTFTFTGVPAGKAASFTLVLTNGGMDIIEWPASIKWAGGKPNLTVVGTDLLTFVTSDGGETWYGSISCKDALQEVEDNELAFSFTASQAGSNLNLFISSFNSSVYPTSKIKAYVNGTQASGNFTSLTFSAGDVVEIKLLDGQTKLPMLQLSGKDYFKSINKPLPLLGTTTGNPYTDFSSFFRNCAALESIPLGLFKNNPTAYKFNDCFSGCVCLKAVPADLWRYTPDLNGAGNMFAGCRALRSAPEGLFANCTKIQGFNSTFANCTNLTSVPENLFKDCILSGGFANCFQGSGLRSIPENLFKYNISVISFQECFKQTPITSIPENLFKYNTTVQYIYDCFAVTNIVSIPEGLFKYNTAIKSFSGCFQWCKSLVSVPENLFKYNTACTSFESCFSNCTALQTVPENIFPTNAVSATFASLFISCSGLLSVPANLFTGRAASSFYRTFMGCTGYTGALPELWVSHSNVTSHNNCFQGCTQATNYAEANSAGWVS